MIDRRTLLSSTLAATLAPLFATPAQAQSGQTWRLAILSPSSFAADEINAVVVPELAKHGFTAGQNLIVTTHVGPIHELPRLAREALATQPNVMIISTNPAVNAVLAQSKTVPIVMAFAGEDPVKAGIAKTLSRPGGQVTGLTNQATELDGKNLSLLNEAVPSARRIAILAIPPPRHIDSIAEINRVAALLKLETQAFFAHEPADYPAAFSAMRTAGCDGLVLASSPEFARDGKLIAQLALEARLPGIGEFAIQAHNGHLIGYGTDTIVFRRRAADFVARILRGTSPGELPIEQPSIYRMAINLRTAKALGLTLPPLLLARADEVIES